MKQCMTCLHWKEEGDFNWRYKAVGIRHNTCRECHHKHQSNWYEYHKDVHLENVHARKRRVRDEAREWVYQYLLSHPCQQCGEADPRVLEFHHEGDKERAVSELVAGGDPIDKIAAEISKCTVLCSNCHRKLTMNERGWFRGKRKM